MKYSDEQIRALRERVAAGECLAVAARAIGFGYAYAHFIVHGLRRRDAGGPIKEKS